ncbi:MAG: winged helix DNA-binding domain-containing protein [Proteobacteria bacterium]|nr:winged helix DNA-binding domain-containing protein [Pseudomonadota bacterium]
MSYSLPVKDARKLILHCQRLNSRSTFGRGIDATLKAIEHLGYVQIDTLSVVSRAHLHTLWNRVDGFRPQHIDKLQRAGEVFEHWAHALAILPMKDYRYSLPMMNRIASGEVHWYRKNKKLSRMVLDRIRAEGPMSPSDFDDKKTSNAMWARSPSKMALEQLFIEGELMIPYRVNFQKFYDLRERVLPASVDITLPSENELCHHLITSFLRANGLGQVKHMSYLRKGIGPAMRRVAQQMEEEGLIVSVSIASEDYYCEPALLELLDDSPPRSSLRILSPFDNAVIQRKRINTLFDFYYQVECYVQKDNRQYGYFCLPLLHQNRLVGRLDARADRKTAVLHLNHLHIEESVANPAQLFAALRGELEKFAAFNGCSELHLHRLSGSDSRPGWL